MSSQDPAIMLNQNQIRKLETEELIKEIWFVNKLLIFEIEVLKENKKMNTRNFKKEFVAGIAGHVETWMRLQFELAKRPLTQVEKRKIHEQMPDFKTLREFGLIKKTIQHVIHALKIPETHFLRTHPQIFGITTAPPQRKPRQNRRRL